MKRNFNRIASAVLVLVLCFSLLPALTLQADAATVNYVYKGKYIYNWGTRGTTATFLSPNAEAFYRDNNTSYDALAALSGSTNTNSVPSSALYSALKNLMAKNHTHITSYNETKDLYQYTDCQGSGLSSKKISSFYSGIAIGPSWDGGWNREHTWPNSKGLGGSDENDIMMLRPTSTSENSGRGNTAYGESSGYYNPNKESGGKYNLHGDVARIMLYTYVRWGSTSRMWGTNGVMESKEVLLKWMAEDPVDTWELGRNDSVEAITGTRNVFVDYPELAFVMFGEDVPTTMQTPSGEAANTTTYTITAASSNTAQGTVTVAGSTITAMPAAGYCVSGYTVVSGSATVTQNGNVFTVRASSDCTVRINFEKQVTVTVRYLENGKQVSSKSVAKGDSITLPQPSSQAPQGYTFRGWVTSAVSQTSKQPTFYAAGSKLTITANTDLYALYSFLGETNGEPSYTWTLVSNASELTAGSKLVIACPSKGVVAGSLSSTYLTSVEANFSTDSKTIPTLPANALVLTLGGSQNAWTLSGSNGLMGASAVKKVVFGSGTTTWTISISNGNATIQNSLSSNGRFLYNYSSPRFTTYTSNTSATMLLPQLFMLKADSGTTYYTTGNSVGGGGTGSDTACKHSHTTNVTAKQPDCTNPGYTAGVYCNDCATYISGHAPLKEKGHSYQVSTSSGFTVYTCSVCKDSYMVSSGNNDATTPTNPTVEPVDPTQPTDAPQEPTTAPTNPADDPTEPTTDATQPTQPAGTDPAPTTGDPSGSTDNAPNNTVLIIAIVAGVLVIAVVTTIVVIRKKKH